MSEAVEDPGHDDVAPMDDHQVIPVDCIRPDWIYNKKPAQGKGRENAGKA